MQAIRDEQLQLLRAAFLEAGAAEALREWQAALPLDDVDVASHAALPQLWLNKAANGVAEPRIQGVHRRAWYTNGVMLRCATEIATVLTEATLAHRLDGPLVIAHHAPSAFAAETIRMSVPAEHLQQALSALAPAGWRVELHEQLPLQALGNGVLLRADDPQAPALRLRTSGAADLPDPSGTDESTSLRPRDTTSLLLELAADEFTWRFESPFRRLLACRLALAHCPGQPDWEALAQQAEDRDLALPMADIARYLPELGVAIPHQWAESLRGSAGPKQRQEMQAVQDRKRVRLAQYEYVRLRARAEQQRVACSVVEWLRYKRLMRRQHTEIQT